MNYTCWFSDERGADITLVGGKGANLSRLASGGFPVPPGFCITAEAYRYLLDVTGLNQVIAGLVQQIDFNDQSAVAEKAAAIRDLIEQQPIPTEIAAEILENYFNLGRQMGCRHLEAAPVAVRSSATAEDLPQASFAGQQDTYLNIRGGTSLLEHARRCWASLWTDRAITYRWHQGFDHQKVYVAVVVQAMVNPEISGILFTANPINGNRTECVINASWGLGEAIVSGIVSPDTFIIDNRDGRILQQQIATKDRQVIYSTYAGAVEEEVPQQMQQRCTLTPSQAAHLAALATRIEQYYDAPQDIEWARAADKWYILQARPITTLEQSLQVTDDSGTYSRAMFVEIFPDGLSPSFLSVVCPLLAAMLRTAFQELGFKHLPEGEPVRDFLNQPYLNVDYIEEVLQDLNPTERRRLVAKFSNIFGHEQEKQTLSLTQIKLAARLFRFVRRFQREIPGLLDTYHGEIKKIGAVSLDDASDQKLLGLVRHISYSGAGPLLNNDFLLIAAIGVYRTLLARLLAPAYGARAEEIVNNLLSGLSGNIVMETNKLIWNLAQTARTEPRVMRILQETDPDKRLAELQELPAAAPFLAQLNEMLQVCGHREQRFDICYPTWGEDPAPILAFVRSYLEMGDAADPDKREAELVAQREALTAEAYELLSRTLLDRLLRRPLFSYLLQQTQWLVRERDTMHFEWTRIFPPARRMQLEIGRRWQQKKLIEHAADIFYLGLPEQEENARFPKPCQELLRERKAAYEANLGGPWPDLIAGGRAVSQRPQPTAAAAVDPDSIAGVAGSPGHAAGPVRIIHGPQDFNKLQPGEILVAPMTNPVWTPLFAIAAGIITEVGGVLSHGAIVAREYGIPAVMSVPGITSLLCDGENVVVDGDRGLIRRQNSNGRHPHKIARNHTQSTDHSTPQPLH